MKVGMALTREDGPGHGEEKRDFEEAVRGHAGHRKGGERMSLRRCGK
jgi:hypothetical protein